jgi:hypothetical protein
MSEGQERPVGADAPVETPHRAANGNPQQLLSIGDDRVPRTRHRPLLARSTSPRLTRHTAVGVACHCPARPVR